MIINLFTCTTGIYNTFMQDDIDIEIPFVDLKESIYQFQINHKDFRIEEREYLRMF